MIRFVSYAAALLAALAGASMPLPAADDSGSSSSGHRPGTSGYHGGGTQNPAWLSSADAIEKRLAAMPLQEAGKKPGDDDFFALGLVEMTKPQPTVSFQVVRGVRKAAMAVADFLSGGSDRQWKPVARTKTELVAKKFLTTAQSIEKKVKAFPLTTKGGKKEADDFFAVGTAELRLLDRHADIRFQVMGGTKEVANFLVAYILAAPEGTERLWSVRFRAKTEEEAEDLVAKWRIEYDRDQARQAEIARIYNARSTTRC